MREQSTPAQTKAWLHGMPVVPWQQHTHAKTTQKTLHCICHSKKPLHGGIYQRAAEMLGVSSGNALYIQDWCFPQTVFPCVSKLRQENMLHSNQSGVLLAFFPPKLAWLNSSPLQAFTMTQNLWEKFSKVKGQAGAWFPLTTSTLLLHVLLNVSPNWLCKYLRRGGWRTSDPAGTCCSQYAQRDVRNFCSELPNILWISASLQIWISSQVCQKVRRDLHIFLQT